MRLAGLFGALFLCGGVLAQESAVERFPSQLQIELLEDGFGAAADRASGVLNALTMSLVKHFEGWIPAAYDDPADYCTIGYGHLIALKKCAQIDLGRFAVALTEAQGEDLLRQDMGWAQLAVEELVRVDLSDDQYGALSSFVFNVGKTNFASSTLLKMLNRGEHDTASLQFARWVRAGGKVMPGLVTRRSCEATLFDGGLSLGADGRFDRSKCISQGAASDVGELIDIEVGEEQ